MLATAQRSMSLTDSSTTASHLITPTKLLSIPRLELSAAVTAARMSVMLKTELEMQIDKRVLLDRFPGITGLHQQRGTKVSRVRC